MDIEIVKEKLAHYTDLMNSRRNLDINAIVDSKLAEQRQKIYDSVKADIDADILKCEHYIEILEDLLKAEETKETAEVNSTTETVTEATTTEEAN